MFRVHLDIQPEKILKKVDKILKKRLVQKIKSLKENPVPHDAKRIENRKETSFRVRIGSYRILYVVFYKDNTILISKIDKRTKVYNK